MIENGAQAEATNKIKGIGQDLEGVQIKKKKKNDTTLGRFF